MRIAQLSDLHLRDGLLESGLNPWRQLAIALARVHTFAPDLLLITGDLADKPEPEIYSRLASVLVATGLNVRVLSGNHDDLALLENTFQDQSWEAGNSIFCPADSSQAVILMLNTACPNREAGQVKEAEIAWLTQHCPRQRRVLLALHHPPFEVGIPGMDAINCAGADLLREWLAAHHEVEALLCGHVHRFVVTTFAGRLAICAPSTVHQIALTDGQLAWTNEMPGLLLHELPTGKPMRTHHVPLAAAPVIAYV